METMDGAVAGRGNVGRRQHGNVEQRMRWQASGQAVRAYRKGRRCRRQSRDKPAAHRGMAIVFLDHRVAVAPPLHGGLTSLRFAPIAFAIAL
ncbi:hypothetical protein GCM10009078_39140 [Cupriavidus gilardii]